jgi:tRNA threonylcarbamoyladenosine biosynthesis protein TsaE
VSLHGDLGAGKTVLATGIARGLGVPESVPVTSPTFTFARAYRGRATVHHLDAYMVRGLPELEAAGFSDLGGTGTVVVVEWGERIEGALPADRLEVTLEPVPDPAASGDGEAGTAPPPRRVRVSARGPRAREALARLAAALAGKAPREAASPS